MAKIDQVIPGYSQLHKAQIPKNNLGQRCKIMTINGAQYLVPLGVSRNDRERFWFVQKLREHGIYRDEDYQNSLLFSLQAAANALLNKRS